MEPTSGVPGKGLTHVRLARGKGRTHVSTSGTEAKESHAQPELQANPADMMAQELHAQLMLKTNPDAGTSSDSDPGFNSRLVQAFTAASCRTAYTVPATPELAPWDSGGL